MRHPFKIRISSDTEKKLRKTARIHQITPIIKRVIEIFIRRLSFFVRKELFGLNEILSCDLP